MHRTWAMEDSTYKQYIPWGLSTVMLGISFSEQAKDYWSDPSPFHVMNWQTEYDDALLADKFGHAIFSYVAARNIAGLFEQSGYDRRSSTWIGSGISLFHQTVVEIRDGYSEGAPYLGFSRGDAIANVIGAGLPLLQHYVPELDFIRMKFSFLALPFEDGWGLTLKRLLNSVKLPMPCIKIHPNIVWYGIRI
ncbi:MAG: YfiM family protein [Ignavibacteriae bacterium]|nr:YfiM family protein [Ignavibacteriota bacterium]